jgi:DNA-directed RNA polymerase subunit beta
VLLKELQSLALDVTVLDENGDEVQMTEAIDYSDEEISRFMEGDENMTARDQDSLNGQNGYRQVSSKEEEAAFDTPDGSFNEVFGDEETVALGELEDYTE